MICTITVAMIRIIAVSHIATPRHHHDLLDVNYRAFLRLLTNPVYMVASCAVWFSHSMLLHGLALST